MILLVDDFHSNHAIPQSDTATTSTAVHMASCLLDVHETIPAIKVPSSSDKLHGSGSRQEICRGGICVQTALKVFEEFMVEYHHTYLASLPEKYR